MTPIHPDSLRLLLRCGWTEVCGMWQHAVHGTRTVDEALELCRGGK